MRVGILKGGAFVCAGVAFCVVVLLGGVASGQGADPDERDARFQALVKESVLARDAGDLKRTAALLEQVIDIRPAPELLNNLGSIYEALGNYRKAVETYRRVVADPKASQLLKRLDATRITLLSPKLKRAWLKPEPPLGEGTRLFVDAAPLVADEQGDLGVAVGALALELVGADGQRSQVLFGTYAGGIRYPFSPALADDAPGYGRIIWDPDTALEAVIVNGYTLVAEIGKLRSVVVPAGHYVIELRQRGHYPVMKSLAVNEAAVYDLTEALEAAPERAALSATTSGQVVVESPAGGGGALSWVTGGGGALSAAVGAAMLGLAASDRAEVEQATEFADVTTMTQSEAYRLQDRADTLSTGGAVLLGLGAAAATTAVILWLTDSDDDGPADPDSAPATTTPVTLGLSPFGLGAKWSF